MFGETAIPSRPESGEEITRLLQAWTEGDTQALTSLLPKVYDDLHRMAARFLRCERHNHTLQTTGLLHEAYLRLMEQKQVTWRNRAHFFAIVAQQMRRILVDYARRRNADKRGAGQQPAHLDDFDNLSEERCREILSLHEGLRQLQTIAPEQSQIVELRYFGGFTTEEIAAILDISAATVGRRWRLARAWLYRNLRPQA